MHSLPQMSCPPVGWHATTASRCMVMELVTSVVHCRTTLRRLWAIHRMRGCPRSRGQALRWAGLIYRPQSPCNRWYHRGLLLCPTRQLNCLPLTQSSTHLTTCQAAPQPQSPIRHMNDVTCTTTRFSWARTSRAWKHKPRRIAVKHAKIRQAVWCGCGSLPGVGSDRGQPWPLSRRSRTLSPGTCRPKAQRASQR